MAAMVTTMIAVDLPDGAIVSFDRVRRTLILTGSGGAITSGGGLPARPNLPSSQRSAAIAGAGAVAGMEEVAPEPEPEVPLEPVSRVVTVMKLGYKKAPIIHSDIWNKRVLLLEGSTLSYHEAECSPPKGVIELNPGCLVNIIQADTPARKDRYEDGGRPGAVGLMSMNIGAMMSLTSTPIGKPNCVELHCPADVGNMLNSVMGASALSLAASGMRNLKKNNSRTYYFSFDKYDEAEDFAGALQNNIKVLSKQVLTPGNNNLAGTPGAAAGLGAGYGNMINNAMNAASTVRANMENMKSPNTSLQYYRVALGTSIPDMILYERLMIFYDQLAAVNIFPSY
jgi:hypothetical protein